MPSRLCDFFLLWVFLLNGSWAVAESLTDKTPSKSVSSQVKANPNKAQKAFISGEQAYIFQQPNFDAEVITILTPSKTVYFISNGKWGPFYKIRLEPGKTGYVLDSDIRIIKDPNSKSQTKNQNEQDGDSRNKNKKRHALSFKNARYYGPVLQMIDFTENTMNNIRHQYLPFYGIKVSGAHTVFDDNTNTEADLLLHWGPPSYYTDATGNTAAGFLILADVLWQSLQQQSKNVMTFFGAGPMFRYSHISSTLTIGNIKSEYALDDMVLGAAFNAGMVTRLEQYALRLDAKYYWERQKYWAIGLAFQFEF